MSAVLLNHKIATPINATLQENNLHMIPSITLTMIDGVQIVVPDSLNLMTPYILLEQQDWFEDEI